MRLAALTTGAGVPDGDFAGKVEEIHARACLIAVSDGTLATLATAELGSLPRGITFDAPAGFSFIPLLAVGAAVAVRGGVLRIAGGALAIDLRRTRPWRCGFDALRLDLGRAPTRRAWRAAWSILCQDGRANGLLRIAGAAMHELAAATRRRDVVAAHGAMSRLVGLGEGRTPAGDDYLVGYFAALRACGGMEPRAVFVPDLGRRLKELAARTDRVSRLYLDAAADGQVSERLCVVAAGIAAGCDDPEIGRAVTAALAVGHSSGACGVLGLLHGCIACSVHACAEAGLAAPASAFSSRSPTARQIAPSSA